MSIRNNIQGLKAILIFDNWPMLVLERLLHRRAGLVIYRKKGMEILIDHLGGDCNGTRAVLTTDMYSKYLGNFVLNGPVRVLDLGANGGGFPLMLRVAGIPVDRAVCVEMNPLTYERLRLNLANNLGPAGVAINAAVCGMPVQSEILLRPSRGGAGEGIHTHRAGAGQPHVAVPTTTLCALFDRYFKGELVDLCKIDVEDAEYEIFDGTPDDLLSRIRYLLIEFHDPSKTPALVARMEGLGFREIAAQEDHKTGENTEVRVFRGPAAEAASSVGRNAA
jgi:FkbM family methyltransferase